MKVLVVFGHDNFDKSVQNKKLLENLKGAENVTLLNLWEKYHAQGFKLTEE